MESDAVYFCCTGLGVTSTGRYPASCPMKPGLSSSAAFRHLHPRLSVLLNTVSDYTIFLLLRQQKVYLHPLPKWQADHTSHFEDVRHVLSPSETTLYAFFCFEKTLPKIRIFNRFVFPTLPSFLNPSVYPLFIKRIYNIL